MTADENLTGSAVPLRRWMVATAGGWFLGILLVSLLLISAEAIGLQGLSAIGLGMGASVGFFQWRLLRRSFGVSVAWILASAIGMACPFVVIDLVGYSVSDSNLILPTALGALLVGLGQYAVIHIVSDRAPWWVPASMLAWALAAEATLLLAIPGHPASALQLLRQLVALVSGGIVLALVTGPVLAWVFQAKLAPAA